MALDLFKLLGTIEVDNSKANQALQETSGEGQKAESKLAKVFGAVGKGALVVGMTIATGLAAGGAAFARLTTKALSASGELEQNMGGSEAVFKDYAGKMQETAKTAFSNMGLSTSDFLATANKMGALFQGAGFDIESSSDLASSAMQRAADVASIMGLDTASAMEAIAGAAKGNFTMMDNLGVAMNDTTLNAYALEKGIGKTTQEMTNQEKIALAMEMFMEKTAYAAGNYAKENETLAGSLGTAKSALTNFLDGSGSVEDLVSSFGNLANVAVKSLQEILPRLTTGLKDIVNQVMPMLPGLLNQLLPACIEGAVSLIDGIVSALPAVLDVLINSALPMLLTGVSTIFESLISALPSLVQTICSALPTLLPMLIDAAVSLIVSLASNAMAIIQPILDCLPDTIISVVDALITNLPVLIEGIIALVMGIVTAIPQIIRALIDALPIVIEMIVTGLLQSLPQLIAGLVQLVAGVVKAIPQIFSSLWDGVVGIFTGIWNAIKNVFSSVGEWFSNVWDSIGKNNPAIQQIKSNIENVFGAIWNVIKTVFTAVKDFVLTVWNSIKNVISTVLNAIWNTIKTVWDSVKNVVSTVINSIKNVISTVWNAIKTIIANVMNIIFSIIKGDWESVWESVKNIVGAIWDVIKSVFNGIWNTIKSVVSGIWNTIKSVFTGVWNTIKSVASGIWDSIKSVFNGIKNTVKGVWDSIKLAMTNPIKQARDDIKGIIDKVKGFFSGMKLEFPNIKLPHFGVSPSGWKIGDLLKGEIPKLSIKWYAEAMNNPMIMTKPTIFGYDAGTGQLLGGGEAGSEVVSGTNTLMKMIQTAVAANNEAVISVLTAILNAILGGNQEMLQAVLAGHTLKIGEREFGRLVKEYA